METSSISGIVPDDTPLVSSSFTDREIIAEHGMYVLVKAKRLGKWFKLKALSSQYARDYLHQELLKKEFELGFQLEHPNIVRTYDFIRDPELGDCIVQEYIQGTRLDDWLLTASEKAASASACFSARSALAVLSSSSFVNSERQNSQTNFCLFASKTRPASQFGQR